MDLPRFARPFLPLRLGVVGVRLLLALTVSLFLLAACGDDGTGPDDPRVIAGVDLDVLFAPPTSAEITAVLTDWQGRLPQVSGFQIDSMIESTLLGVDIQVGVVSHVVDGNRHYAAYVIPFGDNAEPGPLPIVMYLHGGDEGFGIGDVLTIAQFAPELAGKVVWIAPSFRSEDVRFEGLTFTSEGEPSPWDRDVDDAMSLLSVAEATIPSADPGRVSLLGLSRGGGVALLMGIRDSRVDQIVEFFGPTDFFGEYVQDVVADALRENVRDLPGLEFLHAEYVRPLQQGTVTMAEARDQLVRRSAVLFAGSLPDLQVHHGELDTVVEVSQAESLIQTMTDLGRGASPLCPPVGGSTATGSPLFEACLYPNGSHNPLTMDGSIARAVDFLARVLTP